MSPVLLIIDFMAGRFKAGLYAVKVMRDRVRVDDLTYEEAGAEQGYSRQSAHKAIQRFEKRFRLGPKDPSPDIKPPGTPLGVKAAGPQPS